MPKNLAAVALALFLIASPMAEAQTPCKCSEMRDIKNRYCTTRASIREYDRLASKIMDDERKAGKPILLNVEIKENIVKCVREAIDSAADVGAQYVSGGTDCNCNVSAETAFYKGGAPTDCIEESVKKHELFHRKHCLDREKGKWQKVWSEGAPVKSAMFDTKFAMTAVDYIAEEHAAYLIEEDELREALRKLANSCKPNEKIAVIADDDAVAGKKVGDKYNLDPSIDPCPTRPRKTPSKCKP